MLGTFILLNFIKRLDLVNAGFAPTKKSTKLDLILFDIELAPQADLMGLAKRLILTDNLSNVAIGAKWGIFMGAIFWRKENLHLSAV